MTGEHRGVYWKKQRGSFVVAFRIKGKSRHFGQYKTLEEAQSRANEVWPTLPIAQRAVKACPVCKITGRTGKEFYWNNSLCKKCSQKHRIDPWNKWCKIALTGGRKKQRRNSKHKAWVKWARLKKVGLILRSSKGTSAEVKNGSAKRLTNWNKWFSHATAKLNGCVRQGRLTGWVKKAQRWAASLGSREKTRLLNQNCER